MDLRHYSNRDTGDETTDTISDSANVAGFRAYGPKPERERLPPLIQYPQNWTRDIPPDLCPHGNPRSQLCYVCHAVSKR